MNEKEPSTTATAWNPLTPRGLAAFAQAGMGRLFLVQAVFGLVSGFVVIWFVYTNYSPVVTATVRKLPETAKLASGQLKGIDSKIELDGKFLSIVIDPNNEGASGTGDVQVFFDKTNLSLCSIGSSLWGCLDFPYAVDAEMDLSRSAMQPWWGAWRPFIIIGTGVAFVIGLFATLALLALVLMWIPKLIGYFLDKELSTKGAWKLAVAGQLPGVVIISGGIVLYGTQLMDLLGLGIFYGLHVITDVVYIVAATFLLPRISAAPGKRNPFR